jgi:site-specific DNA recombinase
MQNDQLERKNAVIAVRVSSDKQYDEGDSPEAQIEQLTILANRMNARIVKVFEFAESGSKLIQPMQQAITYCQDPKNDVQLFLIKSIDRFTRGGAEVYAHLKKQLDVANVRLIDNYGVISHNLINTLEHLDIEYKWSKYSPSQKSEYLEAERAKDELRDILTRMIGAEVRYTRLGYWMRQSPLGFDSQKIETKHGKRSILVPHPKESVFIKRLFELRALGVMSDKEIIDDLNLRGFQTRIHYVRSKHDRTKVVDKRGGNKLDKDAMDLLLRNPIYAGIIREKWTDNKPVRASFEGLVSIDTFNAANRGKVVIIDNGGELDMKIEAAPPHQVNKGIKNPEFPYRKYIGCSKCGSAMYGSSNRGYNGSLYPSYSCSKGHYFRVPKAELESTVLDFIKRISLSEQQIDIISTAVMTEWERRLRSVEDDIAVFDKQIQELELDAEMTVRKLKMVESETAIKYMEQDLLSIEKRLRELKAEKEAKMTEEPADMGKIMRRVKYFLENLDQLLVKQIDPIKKAQFFSVFFDRIPTYEELKTGTENSAILTGVRKLFELSDPQLLGLVAPPRLELGTQGSSGLCSTN